MTKLTSWSNKNPYERELFALAAGVIKYDFLLRGYHKVILHTDNKAVAQSEKSRSFQVRNLFNRLRIEFPNVTLKHITSRQNIIADVLSRATKCPLEDGSSDFYLKVPVCSISDGIHGRTRSKKKSGNPESHSELIDVESVEPKTGVFF